MPMPSDESMVRRFSVSNGEGYTFRALDYAEIGVKIELYDVREIGIAEENRLHAVILPPKAARELFLWIGKIGKL